MYYPSLLFSCLFSSPLIVFPPQQVLPPREPVLQQKFLSQMFMKKRRVATQKLQGVFFFFFFFSDWKGWRRSRGRESGKRENKRPHTSGGDGASGAGFQIYKQKYIYIHIYINVLYVHLKTPLTRSHYK